MPSIEQDIMDQVKKLLDRVPDLLKLPQHFEDIAKSIKRNKIDGKSVSSYFWRKQRRFICKVLFVNYCSRASSETLLETYA